MPKRPLPPKQLRFVQEYLLDLNATQAAIRAGYSAKTADVTGPRLLGNAGVRAAVDAALAKRAERLEVKQDTILRELLRIGLVDIRKAFDADGNLLPIHQLPEDVARALSGVEVDELFDGQGEHRKSIGVTRKVKFWDKPKALELLGKHVRLFADRVEHTGKDGGPIEATLAPGRVDLGKLSDEELADLRRLLVAAVADVDGGGSRAPAT